MNNLQTHDDAKVIENLKHWEQQELVEACLELLDLLPAPARKEWIERQLTAPT